MNVMTVDSARPAYALVGRMTPSQLRTFDELLAVGQARPIAPTGLVDELRDTIERGTADAVNAWTDRSLWFGKAQLSSIGRCEGTPLAEASAPRSRDLHPATAVGIAAHRAIQLAHTHLGHPVAWYVDQSISASMVEEAFSEFWTNAHPGIQSDLQMQMMSRVTAFLDSWPPLDDTWAWRFEESVQAKIGRLTLGARIDLTLGRPRPDGRQTMLLCDLKTGSLGEHHDLEAAFYALVATLRHGVPPFRSVVYSLASGDWTEPDVTADMLRDVASRVVDGVVRYVAVMTEERAPALTAGPHCRFCPAKSTCPSAEL